MELSNREAESQYFSQAQNCHKIPDSSKFSFKALPLVAAEKTSNHSVGDDCISTKQTSEDANLVIQNRRLLAERIFTQVNPFGQGQRRCSSSKTCKIGNSESASQQSDSEQLITLKKDRKNGSQDPDEDNSIASKHSVSMGSSIGDESPFIDYVQISKETKDIRTKPKQFSDFADQTQKLMAASDALQQRAQRLQAENKQSKETQFVDFKRLIGHPSSGTEQKSSHAIGNSSVSEISSSAIDSNIQVTKLPKDFNDTLLPLLPSQNQRIITSVIGPDAQVDNSVANPQQQDIDIQMENPVDEQPEKSNGVNEQKISSDFQKVPSQVQEEREVEKSSQQNKRKQTDEFDQFDQQNQGQIPKGPKRPLSPYIFFSQEKRKELKQEHPDWNSAQIMKQVSILWQKMSADQKRDFQEQSKIDRDRFEKERQDYVIKKEQDPLDKKMPSLLDTVKQRSKIVKEMQEKKSKYDEYVEALLPAKRKRRGRKNSTSQQEVEAESEHDKMRQDAQIFQKQIPQRIIIHEILPLSEPIISKDLQQTLQQQDTSSFTNLTQAIRAQQKVQVQKEQKITREETKNASNLPPPDETPSQKQIRIERAEVQIERERLVQRITSDISVQKQSEQSTGRFQSRTGSSITQITQLVKSVGEFQPKSQEALTQIQPRMHAFNSLQLQRQRLAQQKEYNRSSVNLATELSQVRYMQTPLLSNSSLQQFNFTQRNDPQAASQLHQVATQRGIPSPRRNNNLNSNSRLPFQNFQSLASSHILSSHNLLSNHQLPIQPVIGLQQQVGSYLQPQTYIPQEQYFNSNAHINYLLYQQQMAQIQLQQQQQQQQQLQQQINLTQSGQQNSHPQQINQLPQNQVIIQSQQTHPQNQASQVTSVVNQQQNQQIAPPQQIEVQTPKIQAFNGQYHITVNTPTQQANGAIHQYQNSDFNSQVQHHQQIAGHQPLTYQTHMPNQVAYYEDPLTKAQIQQITQIQSHTNLTPFQSSIQLPTVPFYQTWGAPPQIYDPKNHLRGNSNIQLNEDEFVEFSNMYLQRTPYGLINNPSGINLNFAGLHNMHAQSQQFQVQHQGQYNLINAPGSNSNLHIVAPGGQTTFYPYLVQSLDKQLSKQPEEQEGSGQIESHNDEELLQLGKSSAKQIPQLQKN